MPVRAGSIREDLVALVDEVRGDVVDELAGLRFHDVAVVTRTWSGGALGRGTATTATLVLEPRPRVRDAEPRQQVAEAGRFEAGDRLVDRVSLTYTRAQLGELTLAAGVELHWTIDGEAYRLVGLTERTFGWEAQLRRVRS